MVLTIALTGSAAIGDTMDYNVVINEIHYDPDVKTQLVEFVELHNTSAEDIDLSGWYFSRGISYQFEAGATLPAGGYIIVVQNPSHIQAIFSTSRLVIPPDLVFGPYEGKLSNDGENIELCNSDGDQIDRVDYQLGFPWPTVGDAVPDDRPGNGHSIQLVNPFLDNDLAGSWRSAYPTPTEINASVYHENTPPHIRQVKHSPNQPKSGEVVSITAKVTDADGVADVTLSYQIVEPGSYINIKDSQYYTDWTNVTMHDDGLDGDTIAGDDIYCVQLPGSIQVHRRLVRYRITITDNGGRWYPTRMIHNPILHISSMTEYRHGPEPSSPVLPLQSSSVRMSCAVCPFITLSAKIRISRIVPGEIGMGAAIMNGTARWCMMVKYMITFAIAPAAASGDTPWARTCGNSTSIAGTASRQGMITAKNTIQNGTNLISLHAYNRVITITAVNKECSRLPPTNFST
jgi:hypothetical protein